ncbi:hypothetical protein FRC02_010777 [Tulasnella sp. 418]|nr:hypothetical protein FRC02_010777 [Tulasnella sp. 418]
MAELARVDDAFDIDLRGHASLYDYLTAMSTAEPSPSIEAAIKFIHAIAQNACKAKRNIQMLCMITRRACDICDAVDHQLQQASEEMDWDAMENCFNVIENLEKFPPKDDWNKDLMISRRHDDIVWLDQVTTSIEEVASVDENKAHIAKLAKEISSALKRAPLSPPYDKDKDKDKGKGKDKDEDKDDDAMVTLSTQCIMKMSSVVKAEVAASDGEDRGTQKWAPELQDQAKQIMGDLLNDIRKGTFETKEPQKRWDKLETSAKFGLNPTAPPPPPKAVEEIMYKMEAIFDPLNRRHNPIGLNNIQFAEINPGYMVFRRTNDVNSTYIQDLRPGQNKNLRLPFTARLLEVNETRTMVVYCIDGENRSYVRLSSIGPLSEIEVEGKLISIFWMQRDMIGLLNANGGFFSSSIVSEQGRTILKPPEWLFDLPDQSLIHGDRLNVSMIMDENELEWMAFNIVVNDVPQVHVWSQKSRLGTLVDGIGTLTRTEIDGKVRPQLIATAPNASQGEGEGKGSISFVIYDLDHRLVNRLFPTSKTEVESSLHVGLPTYVHVVQPQAVAIIVVSDGSQAHAILCDVFTGFKLQESAPDATWLGTFSHEKAEGGIGNGFLVLQPATNLVQRVTIIDQVLGEKRMEWVARG